MFGLVVRALDDDFVRADAVHHVVDAVAALVQVAFDLQRRKLVGDDAHPPARPVRPRARLAVGEDFGRRGVLVAGQKADRSRRSPVRGACEIVAAGWPARGR